MATIPSLLSLQALTTLIASFLTYIVIKIIYRLYFYPLASFPGPKLAAATSLYNAYYDIIDTGLVKRLPEMHKRYGNIVRIQPNELHVADFDGYTQIFRVGTPFDRVWHNNPFMNGSLQSKETLPETKARKEFLSPFFSKSAIARVEPVLHRRKLELFLKTLNDIVTNEDTDEKGAVVNFFLAFRCLTADTVMDYCFQADLGALFEPGFRSKTVETFIEGFDMALLGTYFPKSFSVLTPLLVSLPEGLRERKFAAVHGSLTIQRLSKERVEAAMKKSSKQGKKDEDKVNTMFDAMVNPNKERGQVTPPFGDMVADGVLMIAAGTDTTANVLGTALWHVTQNPEVEARLLEELKKKMPERDVLLDSATLEGEGFEYLHAVVKESLRLAYGVPGRIPRKVPKQGVVFGDRFVPGGTIVTSCQYLQNTDPKTFPSPLTFDPERWLCDAETYRVRDKHMVSFSRGSRSCIGINLAYATLHLTVAHLFRRYEIVTTGYTTAHDMEWVDRFVTYTNGRIKGLVKLRES